MYAFIDAHRDGFAVAPICEVLAVAPSVYCAHRAPSRRSARVRRVDALCPRIQTLWATEHGAFGAKEIWEICRLTRFAIVLSQARKS